MTCKCNNTIPQGRVDLGYEVCVDCSTTEQYGCAPLMKEILIAEQMAINVSDWPIVIIVLIIGIIIGKKIK